MTPPTRALPASARMRSFFALSLGAAVLLSGCDAFGSKDDATTDEIFEQGEIDPTLVDDVGYVPLLPFYTTTLATGGGFDTPLDVAVGFDELLYVPDLNGLHVLDLAGRPRALITEVGGQELRFVRRDGTPSLGGALGGPQASVVQDRRLHLYLTARRDTVIGGVSWDLPVVYHLSTLASTPVTVEDIIWYPFDDPTRQTGPFAVPRVLDNGISDEQVDFTGVGVLPDNSVYVARRGAFNSRTLDGRPDFVDPTNAVLRYSPDGQTVANLSLGATQADRTSSVFPSDVITLVTPPQSTSIPMDNVDLFIAQRPPNGTLENSVVALNGVVDPVAGLQFLPNTALTGSVSDPEAGDGFLFEPAKFAGVTDLAIGRDAAGLLFVTDEVKDSLFVFNPNGVEGVTLSTTGSLRPVPVSFGGEGDGPNQFIDPQGVTYLDRTVYVADTGNNRISRFRLNTDFE